EGQTLGVALLDLSTGEFTAAEYAGADGLQALKDELAVLKPREIVVPAPSAAEAPASSGADKPASRPGQPLARDDYRRMLETSGIAVTPLDGWVFDAEAARRTLLDQLRAGGLEGFGL